MSRWTSARACLGCALLVACGAPDREPSTNKSAPSPRASHHFEAAVAIHDALVAGELDDARAHAKILVSQTDPEGVPSSWREHVDPMWTSASITASATDLDTLTTASARMTATCGRCHAAHDVTIDVARAREGETSGARGGAPLGMLELHGFAFARLWDGLALPSSVAWEAGATALSDAPLLRLGARPTPAETALAARVYGLAGDARVADDEGTRTRVLAELLTTCAACHGARDDMTHAGDEREPP